MGERLVVRIFEKHNEDPLCAIYYHWSGYTAAMFEELKRLIHMLRKDPYQYFGFGMEMVSKEGDPLCAIYYHWSGYTAAMFEELKRLIHMLRKDPYQYFGFGMEMVSKEGQREPKLAVQSKTVGIDTGETDLLLHIIRSIEANGGMMDQDWTTPETIHRLYPDQTFKTNGHRNCGLIAVGADNIERMYYCGEHVADLFLDTETVEAECTIMNVDEYQDFFSCDEDEPFNLSSIPTAPYNYYGEISFDAVLDTANHTEYTTEVMKTPFNDELFFIPCN